MSSTITRYDAATLFPARGSSAPSHCRPRQDLSSSATAQWVFLKSTQSEDRLRNRLARPSRSSSPINFVSSDRLNLLKRPATSRDMKLQTLQSFEVNVSAVQKGADPKQSANLSIGQISGNFEIKTIKRLSQAHGIATSSTNERPRLQKFKVQAKRDYDRAYKSYPRSSSTRRREIEARYTFALNLEQRGEFASALAAYRQVQKFVGGRHAFGYYKMGNLCMRLDKVSKAIDYYSCAIALTKSGDRCSESNITPTPSEFYLQRAAAYRKSGDFEKAAQDYVLLQKCAEAVNCTDENISHSVESTYHDMKRAVFPVTSVFVKFEDDVAQSEFKQREHFQDSVDYLGDKLTTWTLERSQTIARLPTSKRSESDVEYLSDFMQKRFAACAALHPKVCNLLCRELVVSPEGALLAQTPLFLEQEEDNEAASRDCAVYFIFQGRVSMFKTVNRMLQSSPRCVKYPEEILIEGKMCEQEAMWESPWLRQQGNVDRDWKKTQLELCDLKHGEIFGHQGSRTNAFRAYSAVTATTCVIGALSWLEWSRVNRAQHEIELEVTARFLTRAPAFNNIPALEIRNLAYRATAVKITGSKVVCCEGQPIDGLFVVKNGELCQFSSCSLRSPPDMSISFALSGRLSEPQDARVFFTQLETAGDPLSFVRVNDVCHGFLSNTYVNTKRRELLRLAPAGIRNVITQRTSIVSSGEGTERKKLTAEPVALALRRGDCFFAPASWVPPQESWQNKRQIGTSCAKAALVSSATAELLFVSSTDLIQGLSLKSRKLLHQNLQHIGMTNKRKSKVDMSLEGTSCCHFGGRKASNLLEQLVFDRNWGNFKEELVKCVLEGRT